MRQTALTAADTAAAEGVSRSRGGVWVAGTVGRRRIAGDVAASEVLEAPRATPALVLEPPDPRPQKRPVRSRAWLRRIDLGIVVLVLCAVHVQAVLRTLAPDLGSLEGVSLGLGHVLTLFACAYAWVRTCELFGLYAEAGRLHLRDELKRLALSCAAGAGVTVVAHRWIPDAVAYRGPDAAANVALLWTGVVVLAAAARAVTWQLTVAPGRRAVRRVLIVGSGPRAVRHYHELTMDPNRRSEVVGFVDVARHKALSSIGATLAGRLHELEDVLARTDVDEVYIALPMQSCYDEFQKAIHVCERLGVRTVYNVDSFKYLTAAPRYEHVGGVPVAMLTPVSRDAHLPFKRAIDVVASGTALAILSPALLAIALLVKATSPGPVFFGQERFGQHKRRFRMYKFRSMRTDAEEVLRGDPVLWEEYRQNHFKLPEDRDPRITRVGRILRKTSLDELPQLWNVFRGDMSVIGPRPIVPAEVEHYGALATLLLALKPGLTGAWVVQGRSTVGYPRRAEIELSYVRQWSLWYDLRILLRTIPAVLAGRGAH